MFKILPRLSGIRLAPDQGFRTTAYVLYNQDQSETFLIDAVNPRFLDVLKQLPKPTGLIVTHKHLSRYEDQILEELSIPVYLHPNDRVSTKLPYRDPTQPDELLNKWGLQGFLVPGHTAGSVVYHWSDEGGVIFTGDCTTGAQDTSDKDVLSRPPAFLSENDGLLKQELKALQLPAFSAVCSLHGKQITGASTANALWAQLQQQA
eukprot:TRINITY_DN1961_c0_g1_i1.p1 TRINITY_DN1961_c0_g1~~TRINITY_DN1961_c0_g1_i1.p1  ORF type:complete len:205 (-),score=32.67 TRINITY_DN1961_c0_g1_i1:209-823(-)